MTGGAGRIPGVDPNDALPLRVAAIDPSAPAAGPAGVAGVGEAGAAAAVAAAAGLAPTAPAQVIAGADPVAAAVATVEAGLASGALDADSARATLVDAVLAAQLPPGLPPAVVADMRADLEAALVADPTLRALLTR